MTAVAVCAVSGATAAALTTLRASEPRRPRALELVTLAPAALPLAVLCAAVAVALAARAGGRARAAALFAAALAAAIALVSGAWVSPLFLGAVPQSSDRAELRVFAQNLEYGDPSVAAQRALRQHVDILILTELRSSAIGELRSSPIMDTLRFAIGLGPNGPDGTVILSRYPLTNVQSISTGSESRVATVQTTTLGAIELVALHPAPPYQAQRWMTDYDAILRYLTAHNVSARPTVIAGDLNATLDHAPLRTIESMGFRDAAVQLNRGLDPTWPAPGTIYRLGIAIPPFAQIDHVLTSPALIVTDLQKIQIPGADHLGLEATISRPLTGG